MNLIYDMLDKAQSSESWLEAYTPGLMLRKTIPSFLLAGDIVIRDLSQSCTGVSTDRRVFSCLQSDISMPKMRKELQQGRAIRRGAVIFD